MEQNVDELVEAYMKVREERERISSLFEKEDEELKKVLDNIKASLLEICNKLSVDSLKTENGTVIRQVKNRYYTQDWDSFYTFIREYKLPELLEKRIAQLAMKNYLESVQDAAADGLPPGVSVFREYDLSVRKPRS